MRIVSTLDIHSYGKETPELHTALDNLNRFLAAGGRVVYGTDLGNGPIPAGHPRRRDLAPAAGRPRRPSSCSRRSRSGRSTPGEPADVVVLGGNPLEDLNAFGAVKFVLRAGRRMR